MRLSAPGPVVLDRSDSDAARAAVRLLRLVGARVVDGEPRGRVDVAIGPSPAGGASVAVTIADRPGAALIPAEAVSELAGAHAAVAALGALVRARPARVTVDALEVAAACLGPAFPHATCSRAREEPPPADTRPAVARCADGYVTVAASTDADRAALAAAAGAPGDGSGARRLVEERLGGLGRDELVELGQLWRLPVLPVLAPGEVEAEGAACAPVRAVEWPAPARPPLACVTVLDLGMVWAGPYCSRLLGGLGARVVKVEGPTRPDGTRPADSRGCWGLFGDLNRGKESLVLDLAAEDGRRAFLQLVAAADVVVENFSPRVLPNLGLDDAALREANPAAVVLSMPAFGRGRRRDFVGYGGGLELAAGLGLAGPGGRPEPAPVPYLDFLSGCYGAASVLAALLARGRTGAGARLDLAQWDVARAFLRTNGLRPPTPPSGELAAMLVDRPRTAAPAAGACHHHAGLPWRSSSPVREERPAPAFGADSRRVLGGLGGLSPAAVDRLVARGVVVEGGG